MQSYGSKGDLDPNQTSNYKPRMKRSENLGVQYGFQSHSKAITNIIIPE
jgi:hypothetical protein